MPFDKIIRELYRDEIRRMDPDGRYVAIDLENERVEYCPAIEVGRRLSFGDEELCRAFLVAWLCTECGYLPEHICLEKGYTIGRPGGTSAWGDILVRTVEEGYRPYMLIEVKTPSEYDENDDETIKGQLFDVALHEPGVSVLANSTVVQVDGELKPRSLVIDYARYPEFEEWKEKGRPKTADIPKHFGRPVPEPLTKGGKRDLRRDVSFDEYKRVWKRIHNLLWGGHREANVK